MLELKNISKTFNAGTVDASPVESRRFASATFRKTSGRAEASTI